MVPFERALVSSYRPSIVTFLLPLDLRVAAFQSYYRFCAPARHFSPSPHPISVLPQIFPCLQVDGLWATKSECVGLMSVQLVTKISNLHQATCGPDPPTLQTADGRTDDIVTCNRNTALGTIAHRALKTAKTVTKFQTSPLHIFSRVLVTTGWAKQSKPDNFCNNFVNCQPIFIIFGTYTL